MRLAQRIIAGIVIGIVLMAARQAFASFTAPSSYRFQADTSIISGTVQGVCNAAYAAHNSYPGSTSWAAYISPPSYSCLVVGGVYNGAGAGGVDLVASCPSNSTGTTTCTCSTGYVENSAHTACIVDPLCSADGTPGTAGYVSFSTLAAAKSYFAGNYPSCISGCEYRTGGKMTLFQGLSLGLPAYGVKYSSSQSTGQPCSPGTTTQQATGTPTDTCASGQQLVEVNGVAKCFAAGSSTAAATSPAADPQTKTTTNEVENNPDGSTTITSTTTNNITGETNTTVTNYAPGVTSPDLPESVTGPAGEGEDEPKSECELHPETVGCAELGEAPSEDTLGEEERGVASITPVIIGGAHSCPVDVPIGVSSVAGLTFSYAPICTFASGLYPIIIAMAWLTAGLIIVGAKTEE